MTDPAIGQGDVREFDILIIGGGSGNTLLGPELDSLSIALVDDGTWFGGTCLNAGCIPTKMLVRPADVIADASEASRLGVDVAPAHVEWESVRDRVFGRTNAISRGGERYRAQECPNVTLVRESVRFLDAHTVVTAGGVRFRGAQVVIAAGGRPRALTVPHPAGDPEIYDSDSIMRIDALPRSLVILGGGAIAVEFAHVFASFGVDVSIVTRSATLLRALDDDVAHLATRTVGERTRVITGATLEGVRRVDEATLRVTTTTNATVDAQAVLVAQGRVPGTDGIAARDAGFDLTGDGRLVVDDYQRVLSEGEVLPGVFALGDVSSAWQLKHVANHEARVVEHNLSHPDDLVGGDPGPVPSAIFGHPQVAYFGLTEREAREADADVVVVRHDYGATAYGWALEDTTSFCKLVVSAAGGHILGAHIVGPEASILLQPLLMAASLGRGVRGLARAQYWPHPALSEVVENALLKAEAALDAARRTTTEQEHP